MDPLTNVALAVTQLQNAIQELGPGIDLTDIVLSGGRDAQRFIAFRAHARGMVVDQELVDVRTVYGVRIKIVDKYGVEV